MRRAVAAGEAFADEVDAAWTRVSAGALDGAEGGDVEGHAADEALEKPGV